MPMYESGFTYKVEEYGVVCLEADNPEWADQLARDYVSEMFPDATNVEIDYVKEIL